MRTVSFGVSVAVGALLFSAACGGRVDGSTEHGTVADEVPASDLGGGRPPAVSKAPETVAEDLGEPSALAVSGDRLVFVTRSTMLEGELVRAGAVFVADVRTGPALMIAIDRQGAVYETLALAKDRAYVGASDGRIVVVSLDGGEARTLAELDGPAVALAASATHVYAATRSGALVRIPADGGELETLGGAAAEVRGLAALDGALFVATDDGAVARIDVASRSVDVVSRGGGVPCAMVNDDRRVYWTSVDDDGGKVLGVSAADGAVVHVADVEVPACAIAAAGPNLYFATTTRAEATAPRATGGPAPLDGAVGSMEAGAGLGLMRASAAGGEPVRIAEADHARAHPGALAADRGSLYFLTDTAVLRLRTR
jgi:hypothetical protein